MPLRKHPDLNSSAPSDWLVTLAKILCPSVTVFSSPL